MTKVSKKDQDPNQVEKDKSEIEKILSRKSQHFALGTAVVMDGKRYTINQYVHDYVVLIDEAGRASKVRPYFMQWR